MLKKRVQFSSFKFLTRYNNSFNNLQVTLPAGVLLADVFLNGTDVYATDVAAGSNTVGVNVARFNVWTWASLAGELTDF